jgi:hypothetical protein
LKKYIFANLNDLRFERKFAIETLTKEELELMIKQHPSVFSEIYHERFVNNIYFDSIDLQNYFDNVNGLDERFKVRIRWYGDLGGEIRSPVLEFKTKHDFNVGKMQYQLKPFMLDGGFSLEKMREIFRFSDLPEIVKEGVLGLEFSLMNRYSRKYFLSADRKFRITLDHDLHSYTLFFGANTFLSRTPEGPGTILELKYSLDDDASADKIVSFFPFRMTKSSKYIAGVNASYWG